ncbi:MAG TPA: hypothetical protein VM346_01160 [Sphingomicrobium sp.]|nr:hypothetical protein [Sphingomicrobium sp.]
MTPVESEMLKIIRDQVIAAEGRVYDQVATTFRWLMATLFTANGGAIIATLDWGEAAVTAWFAAGLLLGIAMGILSTIWGLRAGPRLTAYRLRLDHSLLAEEVDQQVLGEMAAEKPNWKTWTPSYVGGASFLCLVGGMAAAGLSLF